MIRVGFLSVEDRKEMPGCVKSQTGEHGIARRRMRFVAGRRQILRRDCGVLYIDDDRVRTWHRQYLKGGWDFVVLNDWHGGQSGMSLPQKTALYERLMTELAADEVIYFADAAHPEHQARPADGWVRRGSNPALRRTSGRGRVNIHGAVNLENFDRPFAEPITADGKSSVQLLAGIEARNPGKRRVHVT